MKKILVATNNEGKLKEIREILKGYELISLKDINCKVNVEEDQETFEGNAKKKAKETFEITNIPCIADDSGLCIEEFDGWPGIHTARFLGEQATQQEKNKAILEKMKNLDGEKRNAKFVCTIVYYENGKYLVAQGELKGKIAKEPKGENGFGYDPIFELENGKTYAELTYKEKNEISHRKKALENLEKQLTNI